MCWFNFARFGSKTDLLIKILHDSAWFCVEKLKNLRNVSKIPEDIRKQIHEERIIEVKVLRPLEWLDF